MHFKESICMIFVEVAWNEEITFIYCDIAIECTEIISGL